MWGGRAHCVFPAPPRARAGPSVATLNQHVDAVRGCWASTGGAGLAQHGREEEAVLVMSLVAAAACAGGGWWRGRVVGTWRAGGVCGGEWVSG